MLRVKNRRPQHCAARHLFNIYLNLMSQLNYININTDINDFNVPCNEKVVVLLLVLRHQGIRVLVTEGPSRGLSRPVLGLGLGLERRSLDLGLVF